jgi:hypothetical protein
MVHLKRNASHSRDQARRNSVYDAKDSESRCRREGANDDV